MVDLLGRETYETGKSRYYNILRVIKKGEIYSLSKIRKELEEGNPPIAISIQGIKKHIDVMLRKKEIASIIIEKGAKKMNKDYFDTKVDKKINCYYIATPKSERLLRKLSKKINSFDNPEEYDLIMENIIYGYQIIEISAIYLKKITTSEKYAKEVLNRNAENHDLEKIEKFADEYFLNKIKYDEIKLRVPTKNIIIKSKKYFFVNDELIPVSKLLDFINILEMDGFMKWLAYKEERNRKDFTHPLIKLVKELFIKMVSDSQVKI